jgi:hypothetical protein
LLDKKVTHAIFRALGSGKTMKLSVYEHRGNVQIHFYFALDEARKLFADYDKRKETKTASYLMVAGNWQRGFVIGGQQGDAPQLGFRSAKIVFNSNRYFDYDCAIALNGADKRYAITEDQMRKRYAYRAGRLQAVTSGKRN